MWQHQHDKQKRGLPDLPAFIVAEGYGGDVAIYHSCNTKHREALRILIVPYAPSGQGWKHANEWMCALKMHLALQIIHVEKCALTLMHAMPTDGDDFTWSREVRSRTTNSGLGWRINHAAERTRLGCRPPWPLGDVTHRSLLDPMAQASEGVALLARQPTKL